MDKQRQIWFPKHGVTREYVQFIESVKDDVMRLEKTWPGVCVEPNFMTFEEFKLQK